MSRRSLFALVLAALTIVVFAEVRGHEFVDYDDDKHIVDNPDLALGLGEGTLRVFTRPHYGDYVPLTYVSLLVDRALFGKEPAGTLVVNVLLHAASSVLLFLALTRMTGQALRSVFVAALFAVHPLRVESVAWAFERKDVLSVFFWMLSLYGYARYVERPGRLTGLLPTAVALAAGLLSKPMLVTLPFALLLLDYWPLRRLRSESGAGGPGGGAWPDPTLLRRAVVEKWPLFLLVAVSVVATLVGQAAAAFPAAATLPLDLRIWKALGSYLFYLEKTFWPVDLAVYYPHAFDAAPMLEALLGGLVLVGVTLAAARLARSRPYLIVGWLWFVGTLVPVIGIVQVGLHVHADRYSYVPHVGLALALVWGAGDLLGRTRRAQQALVAAGVAVVLALAVLTWQQVRHWRDTVSLFEHALGATGGNVIAHWRLGVEAARAERRAEAVRHLRAAVEIEPELPEIRFELAQTLEAEGDLPAAFRHYDRVLAQEPGHVRTSSRYGMALLAQGRGSESLPLLEQAVASGRAGARAHAGLAELYAGLGRDREAARGYRRSLELESDYVPVLNNLAGLLASSDDPQVRSPAEAVRLALRATSLLRRPEPAVLDTLAQAYAADGQREQAIEVATRAVALAESRRDAAMARVLRDSLERLRDLPGGEEEPAVAP